MVKQIVMVYGIDPPSLGYLLLSAHPSQSAKSRHQILDFDVLAKSCRALFPVHVEAGMSYFQNPPRQVDPPHVSACE